MNRVQLYTIVHFGGDIVRPKIGSIVTYVGGSTKLTLLRAHSSYEVFVTLLEETSKICHEDWLSTTKDTGSGRGLSTTKVGGPLHHNSFPDPEHEYRGYPKTNDTGLDLRRFGPLMDDEIDSFETIHTDVPPLNEPSIPQSNLSFGLSHSLKQVKDLLDFQFKSAAYTEDPYDFNKEFIIGDLYRDRIELKNHIRAYAVESKFNLEHVLSNEYKIVVCYKGHKCSWRIYAIRLVSSTIFRVGTYCSVHTCIRVETEGGNAYKVAPSRWVASIIKQKLRKDPNYKPSGIIDDARQLSTRIPTTYELLCGSEIRSRLHKSWRKLE
ncbi:hypothetical protein GIB67_008715 [Kingdonia uniflora]|uniref:Transposase MuDR plant domain-containing protein n=1 Tax=Kingdonia uniflora TaxID=39325 RepID=A0A7J7NGJ8_9MAGN|nr:hypothetical protein GIB67_008715 [Kingdonia uniflora]